jgi:hypothetical protein
MFNSIFMAAVAAIAALPSAAAAATPAAIAGLDPELNPPVRIQAAGKPIDTAVGHAAPLVTDFDGDGLPDLLVGQFGDGKLWIFHNEGTAAAPKLAAGQLFKAGADTGRIPSG